jgi:hypothetical protein
MKKLLILIAVACLMIPVMATAQDPPHVYLEIYQQAPETPPPPEACVCPGPGVEGLQCWHAKTQYNHAFVPIHIGKMPFKGIDFGYQVTGEGVMSLTCLACSPDFQLSTIQPEVELYIGSTVGCMPWWRHPGFLRAFAFTAAAKSTFDLLPPASTPPVTAINVNDCDGGRNDATYVHGAEWGGTKSLTCGDAPTNVELTTWGAIKDLFR